MSGLRRPRLPAFRFAVRARESRAAHHSLTVVADALDPYRVAGFVAIHTDVEYDDLAPDAVVASVELWRQGLRCNGERAETAMTRSRARFGESHQPHGVR
jgi:hypothetical protein